MADATDQSRGGARAKTPRENSPRAAAWLALRAADVQLYRAADDLSGLLISAMLVFSPWAFGTTQPWSIWTMNFAGYALGILLLLKLFIREAKGYAAPRWENYSAHSRPPIFFLIRVLAGLTLAILAYCLTSALNAGATYNPDTRLFEYHHCVNWLPHSFDSHRTWQIFWMYLGLAGSFWAICDWLSGMTANEERVRFKMENDAGKAGRHLPARLRWLLWLLCVNGALLGAEAIVQRAAGSDKLLFLVQPTVYPISGFLFGPFAYRSNAAQYFNLLWPLCLGFWWMLQRGGGLRGGGHHVLLFCAAIMAACPIISSSRGGALVAAAILIVAVGFLMAANLFDFTSRLQGGQGRRGTSALLILFFAVVAGLGWYFGWSSLEPRMEQIGEGFEGREEMFELARPMAADYPLFGTGPGTFATVFQLYRYSNATYWPEQLHNDWLETRITFGWIGTALLLAALACIFLRRFLPGKIRAGRRFVTLAWLGLAGCLVHAVFDFPLQVHSILLLFLTICAILFAAGGRARH